MTERLNLLGAHPVNRIAKNQKISQAQKRDLLSFVAGAGENFDFYLKFCERFNIPTFSRYYWRTWVQRHRAEVQRLRKEHLLAVAAEARFGRKERQEALQADIDRLEQILVKQNDEEDELTVDQVVKIMDQKRKNMEALAKEMGEWGVMPDTAPPNPAGAALGAAAAALLQIEAAAAAERAAAPEADYREVTEEEDEDA